MITDTESKIAVDTTFNSILNEIQLSNLNFVIQLSPYAAYITLKKSTQVDRNGVHLTPSPPILMLLQESNRDRSAAHDEIARLSQAFSDCEKKCDSLQDVNALLLLKLKESEEKLSKSYEANANLLKKLNIKEKEVETVSAAKINANIEFKQKNKELFEQNRESDIQIKALNKTVKLKEKEIYNTKNILANSQNTVVSLKAEVSSFKAQESRHKSENRRLMKQLKNFETRHQRLSEASSQTTTTVDVPYAISEPLPPIFGAQVCIRTRRPFISKSLPDISTVALVKLSEDDLIQEAAEEALSVAYDREIAHFYNDARVKAANLRQIYDENLIGKLFDPDP